MTKKTQFNIWYGSRRFFGVVFVQYLIATAQEVAPL
jgi:hypothetical protein